GNSVGVAINGSSQNLIGGTVISARNIISGNSHEGLLAYASNNATDNLVQGNFVGLDVTGTSAIGKGDTNVSFQTSNNIIGGIVVGARNIIAASQTYGVSSSNPASGNQVQGNYIGTDVTG